MICSESGEEASSAIPMHELLAFLPQAQFAPPLSFFEKCSILDDMPVAYCVIELVFDADGHGVDFVFRYCNKHMAVVEGIPVEEMLNRSFHEVFKYGYKRT